ncbi:hypothetical protein FGB62_1g269 [Gracilaria domingensis]|nr:hypothetical protein FGB62_1g269 [Gracilaria domingensis]
MCGNQPDSAPCFCVINVPKARHALDFSVMAPGMCAHLGSFEGVAVVNFALQGLQLQSSTMSNKMTISDKVDEDLIDRLSRCVISDELSKSPETPLRDLILRSSQLHTAPSKDQSNSNTDNTSSSMSSTQSLSVSDSITPVPLVLNQSQTCALMRAICEPHTRTSSVRSDFMDEKNAQPSSSTELDATSNDASEILQPTDFSLYVPTGAESNEPWISPQFGSTIQGCMVNLITGEELDALPPAPMDEDLTLTGLIAEESRNGFAKENCTVPSSTVQPSEPVAIAPALQFPKSANTKPKTQEEKERRAELRRQRNREAAHRSNLKRKIKNDTLKADLKKWHGKVSELRRIEVGLREENLKLRKLLSEG